MPQSAVALISRLTLAFLGSMLSGTASADIADADVTAQFGRSADPLVRILAQPAEGGIRVQIARSVRDRRSDVLLQRLLYEMGEAAPDVDAAWFAAHAPTDKYHWVMKLSAKGLIADDDAIDSVLAQIGSPQTQSTEWRELLWRVWQAGKLEIPNCLWDRDELFDTAAEVEPLMWPELLSQWSIKDDFRLLESVCAANRLEATAARRELCIAAGTELEMGETAAAVHAGQNLQRIALPPGVAQEALEKRRQWPLVNGIADADPAHRLRVIAVGEPRAKLEFQAQSRYQGDSLEIIAALPAPMPAPAFTDAFATQRVPGASLQCGPIAPAEDATDADDEFDALDLWTLLGTGDDPVVTWLATYRMHPEYETRLAQAQSSDEPIIQRSLMLPIGPAAGARHRGPDWLLAKEPESGLAWMYALFLTDDPKMADRALEAIAAYGVQSDFIELQRRIGVVADATVPDAVWARAVGRGYVGDRAIVNEFIKLVAAAADANLHSHAPPLSTCTAKDVESKPEHLRLCLQAARALERSDSIHVILNGLVVQRTLSNGAELAHVQERLAAWERIDALDPISADMQEGLRFLREQAESGQAQAKLAYAVRVHGKQWPPFQTISAAQ